MNLPLPVCSDDLFFSASGSFAIRRLIFESKFDVASGLWSLEIVSDEGLTVARTF